MRELQSSENRNTENNMKRPNITPGPWNYTKGVIPCVNAQIERTPINVAKTIYGSHDDALANARAIAALPDLLAALEAALSLLKCANDHQRESGRLEYDTQTAKNALTKAGYTFNE